MMLRAFWTAVLVLGVLAPPLPAQRFRPASSIRRRCWPPRPRRLARRNFRCVTFSGSGYAGAVGQTVENAVNIDWPRIGGWPTTPAPSTGRPAPARRRSTASPAWSRRRGSTDSAGWTARRRRRASRQTHIVNGGNAWHIDGDGPPVAVAPELAELYRLDLWLNPPGFIKAARLPGANPIAFWRWEQIEKGRDGNVVSPERVHVVAITDAREVPGRRDHQLAATRFSASRRR